MRWSLTVPRAARSVAPGRQRRAVGTTMDRMTHQAAPTPMSTSPTENTLASGIGRGSANTSPRNGRVVPAPMSVELREVGRRAAAPMPLSISHAPGADGMKPPLATMTSMFSAAPRASSGNPGRSRLRSIARNTSALDATYSSGPASPTRSRQERPEQQQLEQQARPVPAPTSGCGSPPGRRPVRRRPDPRAAPMTMAYSRSIRRQLESGIARHGSAPDRIRHEGPGTTDTRTARRGGAPRSARRVGSPAAAAAIDCRRSPVSVRRSPPTEWRGQHECERGQGGEAEGERCGAVHLVKLHRCRRCGRTARRPGRWPAGGPGRDDLRRLRLCGRGGATLHPHSVP